MNQRPDVATALTEAARHINSPRTVEATLKAIVDAAVETLPGIDHVGISLAHSDGRLETKAASDQFCWTLDELQYELGEGPCLHAMKEPIVVVEHADQDTRWPAYMPRAVELGLKSQMGLKLYVDESDLGGLNMYSVSQDTLDPDLVDLAEMFAAHAALALGRARREEHLSAAMATRKVIGQAIGLIMERYGLSEDRAFDFLTRVSQASNVKLRDVAQEIVASANDRGRGAE